MAANFDERRLWIGNLDTRMTEFQLLKIVQQCGPIEKFDMLFHKSGPLYGQPRGYAFVTYSEVASAQRALERLSGHQVGCKTMVIRLAKNINYDELDRHGRRLEIPALTVGGGGGSGAPSAAASAASAAAIAAATVAATQAKKLTTHATIQAIEAKLRALENSSGGELVINQPGGREPPLIHRYQYNTLQQQEAAAAAAAGWRGGRGGGGYRGGGSSRGGGRYAQGPYSRGGGGRGGSRR